MPEKFLTTTRAAQLCHVSRFTMRNWANRDMVKSVKTAGGHRRILLDDLSQFMEERQMTAAVNYGGENGNGKRGDYSKSGGNGHKKNPPNGNLKSASLGLEFVKQNGSSGFNCAEWSVFQEKEGQCFFIVRKDHPRQDNFKCGCAICEAMNPCQCQTRTVQPRLDKTGLCKHQNISSLKTEHGHKVLHLALYQAGKYASTVKNLFMRFEENDSGSQEQLKTSEPLRHLSRSPRNQQQSPREKQPLTVNQSRQHKGGQGLAYQAGQLSSLVHRSFCDKKRNGNKKKKRWRLEFGRAVKNLYSAIA